MKQFRILEEGYFYGTKTLSAETKEEALELYKNNPCAYEEYTYLTENILIDECE